MVEDWVVENRSREMHDFHIHQIHFLLLERDGALVPRDERQFLDTVNIPFWNGSGPYPSVKLRMDFRNADPGESVFHCHILEHEDGGMMAVIRILPSR
jgi:FtsP/CotA-like multicopper oxidase with cupredoxin domain